MKNKNLPAARHGKKGGLFLFVILLLAGFFGFSENVPAEEKKSYENLFLTEIMYDPSGKNDEHSKWLEVYNNSADDYAFKTSKYGSLYRLSDIYVCEPKADGTCNKRYIYGTSPEIILKKKAFLIIATNVDNFKNDYSFENVLKSSTMSLSSGDNKSVSLCFQSDENCFETIKYSDFYKKKAEGYPLEKIDMGKDAIKDNWQEGCLLNGTPGKKNSVPTDCPKEKPKSEPPKPPADPPKTEPQKPKNNFSIKISRENMIYPGIYADFTAAITDTKNNILKFDRLKNEKGNYTNQYACFIDVSQKCDPPVWKFTWNFGDNHKSYLFETRHKYALIGDYPASLTVSADSEKTVENFIITVSNFPETKIRILSASPNPEGKDSKKEWLELRNDTKEKINLLGWSIATGWDKLINHPIKKDFEIKPGKKKKITGKYSSFTLNNTKTKIELRNPLGMVVDELTYKDKEGVVEDAVYKKSKNKWKWVLPETVPQEEVAVAKLESQTAETPASPDIATLQPVAISTADKIVRENTGKYSSYSALQEKKRNKIALLNYSARLDPDTHHEILSKLFEIQIAKAEEGNYVFENIPHVSEKHWAVKFGETILTKINSFMNSFFLNSNLLNARLKL